MLLSTPKLCTEADETEHDKHSEKYWRTWCLEWISYYCISHSIFIFMNTPRMSAVAMNKGKHFLQETLPHGGLRCSIQKAPLVHSNRASWNCPRKVFWQR